jgi:hypothetical protein
MQVPWINRNLESVQKGVAPTARMEFLGITVDTVKLTLKVTPERVTKISLLVEAWLRKKKGSYHITYTG